MMVPAGENHYRWKGDGVNYGSLHDYLNYHYPKTGACEECKRSAKTDYALIHGSEYSRNREDYRELCRKCHRGYDHLSQAGEKHWHAKLTEADVYAIKAGWPGKTQQALAQEYGVHQATISDILHGRTWRHLIL